MFKRLGRKVVSLLLFFCRMRFKTPRLLAKCTDFLICFFYPSRLEIEYKESRTRLNSWRQSRSNISKYPINASLEVIIVSLSKDFEILKYVLDYADKACANFKSRNFTIIVPSSEIEQCKSLFNDTAFLIRIIDENEILDIQLRRRIKEFNPNRYGWCLQQFLKLKACSVSDKDYCLILDSDTLLLHPRQWVNPEGKTLLMPTEEFHQPYFDFISYLGIQETSSSLSFVAHHMVIDPQVLRFLLKKHLGENYFESLLNVVETYSNPNISSPFCIDYEFYAQFASRTLINSITFEKWSNLGLSRDFFHFLMRNKTLIKVFSFLFSSISFHSWSVK